MSGRRTLARTGFCFLTRYGLLNDAVANISFMNEWTPSRSVFIAAGSLQIEAELFSDGTNFVLRKPQQCLGTNSLQSKGNAVQHSLWHFWILSEFEMSRGLRDAEGVLSRNIAQPKTSLLWLKGSILPIDVSGPLAVVCAAGPFEARGTPGSNRLSLVMMIYKGPVSTEPSPQI